MIRNIFVAGCESFTIRNGRVNGNMRSVGTSITFECDPMYIAAFEKFGATCLANGSWTYQPACEKGFVYLLFIVNIFVIS